MTIQNKLEEQNTVLITGANGLLGSNLVCELGKKSKYEVFATSLHKLPENLNLVKQLTGDLSDIKFVNELFALAKPQFCINTVALTNLELCEKDPILAQKINVTTASNVAKVCKEYGTRLIHISTDHLFDGKESFYTEESIPCPLNVYAKTKLEAEKVVLENQPNSVVVRTNFYGRGLVSSNTFFDNLEKAFKERTTLTLFDDYFFTPIDIYSLIEALVIIMESDLKGIFNVAGAERCSKYEFGMKMAEIFGYDSLKIVKGKLENLKSNVKRQADLSLSLKKLHSFFPISLSNLYTGLKTLALANDK